MVSGLYDLPGFSATAMAAAWAKRFEAPMTKVSKVYFGFSRAPISLRGRKPLLGASSAGGDRSAGGPAGSRSGAGSWRPPGADGATPARAAGRVADRRPVRRAVRRGRLGGSVLAAGGPGSRTSRSPGGAPLPGGLLVELDRRGRGVQAVVDGDHDLHRPAVAAGQRVLDLGAEADLEQVAGEVARHRDDHHVVVDVQRFGVVEPAPQLGRGLQHHLARTPPSLAVRCCRRRRSPGLRASPSTPPEDVRHPGGGRRHPTDSRLSVCRSVPLHSVVHTLCMRAPPSPGGTGNEGGDVPWSNPRSPRYDVK